MGYAGSKRSYMDRLNETPFQLAHPPDKRDIKGEIYTPHCLIGLVVQAVWADYLTTAQRENLRPRSVPDMINFVTNEHQQLRSNGV